MTSSRSGIVDGTERSPPDPSSALARSCSHGTTQGWPPEFVAHPSEPCPGRRRCFWQRCLRRLCDRFEHWGWGPRRLIAEPSARAQSPPAAAKFAERRPGAERRVRTRQTDADGARRLGVGPQATDCRAFSPRAVAAGRSEVCRAEARRRTKSEDPTDGCRRSATPGGGAPGD